MVRRAISLGLATIVLLVVGGCLQAAALRGPDWLDGRWLLEYSNSPNPSELIFTDGKVTAELAGGFEPTTVLWATRATIDGNSVSWAYGSSQWVLTAAGWLFVEGSLTFSGTIQDDGSIAGTMTVSGTGNGVPFTETVGFIMYRL